MIWRVWDFGAVIASEAKQSMSPLAALWIASSQELLAMTAENVARAGPYTPFFRFTAVDASTTLSTSSRQAEISAARIG